MIARIIAALVSILVLCAPASAQNNWTTPGGSQANGVVNMCLNASGQAVPCAPTAPLVSAPAGPYPSGATPITAASGNVAAATATATLAATSGKTTYICGFTATAGGATAVATVDLTVANVVTGTMTFSYSAAATANSPSPPLVVPLNPCIPANAVNTTIVVTLPSLGAGNAHAAVNAWGYQL